MNNTIQIEGAKVHNLRNLDIKIPREKLVVITGLSGSGKSSLAFDTIHAEGQRRYMETFSAYIRQFVGNYERPDVEKIEGLTCNCNRTKNYKQKPEIYSRNCN